MNIINNLQDKKYPGGLIKQTLVHHEGEFYIASENTAQGYTLIFSAIPTGDVTDYLEVGGSKDVSLEEVLADFEEYLFPVQTLSYNRS